MSSKAEDRIALIEIVRFNDLANSEESLLVFISSLSITYVVKGFRSGNIAIASGVVDGSDERDLPASSQVIQEG